jgi:hypothetical protein
MKGAPFADVFAHVFADVANVFAHLRVGRWEWFMIGPARELWTAPASAAAVALQ